ncbi:MAG: hypothetical protein U0414_12135 [Polyangiaceae bacterium]
MAFTSRATALAALGLEIDARATVSRVRASFTGRAGSVTVVELLIALSGRKVAEARAIADGVSDVTPLDARAEPLVDLLRARDPAGAGGDEMERLREDLTDEGARAFVLATAPDVLRAFERGRAESSPSVVMSDEEAATIVAEEEAEAAESEAARPRRVAAGS